MRIMKQETTDTIDVKKLQDLVEGALSMPKLCAEILSLT